MSKRFTKKGQGISYGNMMIIILIAGFVLGISGTVYAGIAKQAIVTGNVLLPEVDGKLMLYRFVNIDECFAKRDPATGRVIPYVLDANRFHEADMERCYPVEEKSRRPCYQLQLIDLDTKEKVAEVMSKNFVHCRAVGARTSSSILYVQYEKEGEKGKERKQGKLVIVRG